jgi:hypothetical protein
MLIHLPGRLIPVSLLLIASAGLRTSGQSPDAILAGIGEHVREFEELRQNLVCTETVTAASTYARPRMDETIRVTFSRPTAATGDPNLPPFIISVPAAPGPAAPGAGNGSRPALDFAGPAFGAALIQTLSAAAQTRHDYEIQPSDDPPDSNALVLTFQTRSDRGLPEPLRVSGVARIEADSLRIVSLENQYPNYPGFDRLAVRVEYGEMTIGSEGVWIPLTLRTEAEREGYREVNIVEYGPCRRFGASVSIRPAL